MRKIKLALVQATSGADVEANLEHLKTSVARAAQHAQIVLTPENIAFMPMDETTPAFAEEDHPFVRAGKELAGKHGVYLLLGSLLVEEEDGRRYNRSIFIDPKGEVLARYDKIHLFDVELSSSETHGESRYFSGGDKAVVLETPMGKFGFTVCYDLRQPGLFQALAKAGAECIFVPSAFTKTTGERGHWEMLLRARAIENRCFVVGIGQCGAHGANAQTFGHSMAVDPEGRVIVQSPSSPLVFTEIDLDEVAPARASIPSLQNARPFEVVVIRASGSPEGKNIPSGTDPDSTPVPV